MCDLVWYVTIVLATVGREENLQLGMWAVLFQFSSLLLNIFHICCSYLLLSSQMKWNWAHKTQRPLSSSTHTYPGTLLCKTCRVYNKHMFWKLPNLCSNIFKPIWTFRCRHRLASKKKTTKQNRILQALSDRAGKPLNQIQCMYTLQTSVSASKCSDCSQGVVFCFCYVFVFLIPVNYFRQFVNCTYSSTYVNTTCCGGQWLWCFI